MSWSERLFGICDLPVGDRKVRASTAAGAMSPGLTGNYDWGLREKAGEHQPPPPPECMGIEGEYDQQGLAKRVAIAFDRVAELADIDTVTIVQDGSTIILVGTVLDRAVIDRLHQVASQVDGTKQVDVTQVSY
ncbi:hypothetical protein NDI45_18065 [Leptolyngbya sp. GB1-A1]|uniref:BON domain-containing protein n=1 Tax=Leptolyngbya sp. GB1-A1 TaxID=2933908 RepID=UPI00329911B0